MNDIVTKLVDALFNETEMTAEAQTLHDELMANCQERYTDLVNQGRSGDEAAAMVMESLKGMEEVIASYPKKPAAERAKEEKKRSYYSGLDLDFDSDGIDFQELGKKITSEINDALKPLSKLSVKYKGGKVNVDTHDSDFSSAKVYQGAESMEDTASDGQGGASTHRTFDAALINKIDCSVFSDDVAVYPVQGSEIVVTLDPDISEYIVTEILDGTLNIHSKAKQNGWSWSFGIFFANHGGTSDVRIGVPEDKLVALSIHSSSGDIAAKNVCLSDVELSSSSGDIILIPVAGRKLGNAQLNTSSGEITAQLAAQQLTAKTMSGDVNIKGDAQRMSASSISGDVSFKGCFVKGQFKSTSGDAEVRCMDASVEHVELNSTSGDVKLMLPGDVNGVDLKASTVSGDVRNDFPTGVEGAVTVFARSVSGDVTIARG